MNTSIQVTSDELIKLLETKIVKFQYIKNKGEIRTAYGTTDKNTLPKNTPIIENDVNTTDKIMYIDLEKRAIRTILLKNNDTFTILDSFNAPLQF